MGFNTAALILNDGLHNIQQDTEIGQKIYSAIATAHRDGGDISSGGHYGVMTVLPPVHADYFQVVLIGHNTIKRLSTAFSSDPEAILRGMADEMGYSLRKRARKGAASPAKGG